MDTQNLLRKNNEERWLRNSHKKTNLYKFKVMMEARMMKNNKKGKFPGMEEIGRK